MAGDSETSRVESLPRGRKRKWPRSFGCQFGKRRTSAERKARGCEPRWSLQGRRRREDGASVENPLSTRPTPAASTGMNRGLKQDWTLGLQHGAFDWL